MPESHRSAEQRYRVLADVATDAIITMDESGNILSVNPAATRIFGYGTDELLGKPLTLLIPERLRAAHRAGVERFIATGERHIPWDGVQLPGLTRDGREIPLEIAFGEFVEDGRRVFAGYARDISERVRQSTALEETAARLEQTLQELRARSAEVEDAQRWSAFLAEASRVLASSLDYEATLKQVAALVVPLLADWCVIDVAEEGQVRRVEVEHADPALAEPARTLCLRPLDPGALRDALPDLASGRAVLVPKVDDDDLAALAAGDAEHLRVLHEIRPRSVLLAPLLARGRTVGTLLLLSTRPERTYSERDRMRLEELAGRAALALDNARLYFAAQQASRAKSDFLSVMSHELRTPLSAIIGYGDLIRLGVTGATSPDQTAHLQRIDAAAKHLLQLIEEILSFASYDEDRTGLRVERVSLAEIVGRAAAMVEPTASAKGLRLLLSAPDGAASIETDVARLLRILMQLLSNAVKFTEGGEVQLSAALGPEETVCFTVTDTGHGIAPQHLEKVFESFWQADPATTRRTGGTGIGLAIAKRLTRILGGELRVESTPGEGSSFTLLLPARQQEGALASGTAEASEPSQSEESESR